MSGMSVLSLVMGQPPGAAVGPQTDTGRGGRLLASWERGGPGAGATNRSQEPGAGARSQEPGARSHEPGAKSRGQKPGARSLEPGARSQEPGAKTRSQDQEQGARSRSQEWQLTFDM